MPHTARFHLAPARGSALGWLLGALGVMAVGAIWVSQQLYWGADIRPAAFNYASNAAGDCAQVTNPEAVMLPPYWVRAPLNYRADVAHPLLIVFSPAGFGPALTERHTGLTRRATASGIIVVYVASRPLNKDLATTLAQLPARIAQDWCVDATRISFAGHSDGGTLAQAVALLGSATPLQPRAIAASGAGIQASDFATFTCPARLQVLLMHGKADTHFPDYGSSAAHGWAQCLQCGSEPETDADGCLQYSGCSGGLRLCLHPGTHRKWPDKARELVTGLALQTP